MSLPQGSVQNPVVFRDKWVDKAHIGDTSNGIPFALQQSSNVLGWADKVVAGQPRGVWIAFL